MQPSEEIKAKIDIVDLLRDYIHLKPAGMNFRARCPFHNEKTPSLMVSPEKQIWHCFGCGKGGDIFAFIMEMEGLEFVEALRYLAPKAGVTLSRQNPELASKRNRLLDAVDLARRYYNKVLLESPAAAAAREYLSKRGVGNDAIEEWQIGYSPDAWDLLLRFLLGKGLKEGEIEQAGLISKSKGGRSFDRFRGRIMFPLNDINGNTVAFSARVSPEKEATEKMGKYINSPQTPVYDKSRLIFGMDKAKKEIKGSDMAVIVEGQMDVITAHLNGFANVIATSGTALTAEHVRLIKRFTGNIALSFDMDEAGSMAVERGIKEALAGEMNIRVIRLPEGKDPDECIRANPEFFRKALKEAVSLKDYFFARTFGRFDASEMEGRRQAAKSILNIAARIANGIERDIWIKELAEKIGVTENVLRETLAKSKEHTRQERPETAKRPASEKKKFAREEKLSDALLALLLRFPELIEYSQNNIQSEEIAGQNAKTLYRNLLIYYNNHINAYSNQPGFFSYHSFLEWLKKGEINYQSGIAANQSNFLDRLVLLSDGEYSDFSFDQAKNEIIKVIIILKRHYLLNRLREIEREISRLEKSGSERRELGGLMQEFKLLSEELRELKN